MTHTYYPGFLSLLLTAISLCVCALPISARKVSFSQKADKTTAAANVSEVARGSFLVASQCPACNNNYTLNQVVYSGYDKPLNSSTESFFITNNTDRTMTGAALYIEYLTLDGRQLNKVFLTLSCDIPPGETRQLSNKCWDRQHAFRYELSPGNRKHSGTPFKVVIDPISYSLRY